jgi:putative flavoprotein involved in K+ transport
MRTDVAVIGAGQAGLAASRCLTGLSIDHVVVERGHVANSWRTERWDSLRLLTPNWLSRLPGWKYNGGAPDGYMSKDDFVEHLARYRESFDAPVHSRTEVESVRRCPDGFRLRTSQGEIDARAVVVASGANSRPRIPAIAGALPTSLRQLSSKHYRNVDQIDSSGVLVVGASASGAQIADELARAGREVTLAVGSHTRIPRRYRGRDTFAWLESSGILDDRWFDEPDIAKSRRAPSLQLVGTDEGRDLDLNALSAAGVQLVGRLVGVSNTKLQFSGSLANTIASADQKMHRLLARIDQSIDCLGADAPDDRPEPTRLPPSCLELELTSVATIIWATGFHPSYPWLPPHVLDRRGAVVHAGGVMEEPGMYVLGLPFLRRRKSSFIEGAGLDAVELMQSVQTYLGMVPKP